ncbi:hypothetical protein MMC24_007899 [Lignoscripta atroalba]|nr:hypothetical protein [Lignoscripta atroalba]
MATNVAMVNSVSQGSSPTPALQLLESICISAKQPVLCLRGGGADNKRKEARIRKFAHISHDAESEGTSGSQAFKKPKKQATLTQNSESTPSLYQRKVVGVTENAETTEAIQDKPQRFICFIGNLPFTATSESITQHFAKLQPSSVRHRTSKETGRSKGFAFLEFDHYDRMKTCLKLFHHSTFDDGISPPRKINVELTVGGGGSKSKDRRLKLQEKNERLSEERRRRALEEEKWATKPKKDAVFLNPTSQTVIHPSRRSRVSIA